jgi:hypothetical protein
MEENKDGKGSENQPSKQSGTIPSVLDTSRKSVPETEKGISKASRFFRSILIWLGVIAVAFLAGVGTYHSTRYAPLDKSLGEAQTDLEEANSELSILRSDNQKSDTTISTLQEELDKANAHVDILQLLADANEARLALIAKDIEGAKTALENSAETLESILPLIAEVDANLAQSMSQRLGLIISELERDSASAQVDLELLTKDLLTAEEALSK